MAKINKTKIILCALVLCALLLPLFTSCSTDTVIRYFDSESASSDDILNTDGEQNTSENSNPGESIELNVTGKTLNAGDTFSLIATVVPAQKYQPKFSYSSNDLTVATVNGNGTVRAIRAGSCVITVTTGILSASCAVTVIGSVAPTPTETPVTQTPTDTPVTPTPTDTPVTPTPTDTPVTPTPSETSVTTTPTDTSVVPTETPVTPTPTETPVTPTPTETPLTPTPTETPITPTPTDTSVTPTPTETPVTTTPTETPVTPTPTETPITPTPTETPVEIPIERLKLSIEGLLDGGLYMGGTFRLVAQVYPENATGTYTFEVSDSRYVVLDSETGVFHVLKNDSVPVSFSVFSDDDLTIQDNLVRVPIRQPSTIIRTDTGEDLSTNRGISSGSYIYKYFYNLTVGQTMTIRTAFRSGDTSIPIDWINEPRVGNGINIGIDRDGQYCTIIAQNIGPGAVTAQYNIVNVNGVSEHYSYSVYFNVVELSVAQEELYLEVGSQLKLPLNAKNIVISLDYRSDNTSVVKVDGDGVMTAISAGTANVTVETPDKNVRSTCRVIVHQTPYIQIENNSFTLNEGETAAISASLVNVPGELTYSVGDTTVASVDASGVITANAPGNTVITVSSARWGVTAQVDVTVLTTEPTKTPVTPTPTETPVTQTPTETPVTSTPTETPVPPTPTETPVTPTQTETPVTATPTETPVTPTPAETPVTPTPTETPAEPSEPPAEQANSRAL